MTVASSVLPEIRTLTRGARIILVPIPGTGLVAAQARVLRGSADESESEFGLASFTTAMLRRGAAGRSSSQIAFDLESLGAIMSEGGGPDATTLSIRAAAADFSEALSILLKCLTEPAFDPQELEIERMETLAALRRAEDDKFSLTYREYLKRIFAGHGYGHDGDGEMETVQAIQAEDCRRWHERCFAPANLLFTVVGDFDPDEICGLIEDALTSLEESEHPRYETHDTSPLRGIERKRRPNIEQGFIVMGYPTPRMDHPDFPSLRLGCAILGEGFAGRLFTHLRDERSLAYAVGSTLRTHRLTGHMALYIGTQPSRLEESRQGLLDEVEAMRSAPPTPEDLDRAKEYVAGKFLMSHQSLAARAGFFAQWEDLGLGVEYDTKYVDDLRRVGAEEVHEAANKWWSDPSVMILEPESGGEK